MQSSSKLAKTWKHLIIEMGRTNALLYVVDRLLHRLSPTVSLHRYYLGPDDPIVYTFSRPRAEIQARYRQGAVCFAAFRGEKMLGYFWVLLGPYRDPEHRCTIRPVPAGEVAWDFDLDIVRSERLGFTFAHLWDAANAYLRANRIRWTLSRISAFNPVSLTSHRRLGAQFMFSTVFLTVGSWQVLLASTSPFIHLSTSRNIAPTIIVRPPQDSNRAKPS
jgi:hypothetical protein